MEGPLYTEQVSTLLHGYMCTGCSCRTKVKFLRNSEFVRFLHFDLKKLFTRYNKYKKDENMSLPSFYPAPFKIQEGQSPEVALSEGIFANLYAYMASEDESFEKPNGETPLYSIYRYSPNCPAHFSQMLEFYWTNSFKNKSIFVEFLKKEGIVSNLDDLLDNFETLPQNIGKWMTESDNHYKKEGLNKLCIATTLAHVTEIQETRLVWTKSLKKGFPNKVKGQGYDNETLSQIITALEPLAQMDQHLNQTDTPITIYSNKTKTHRLDAQIIYKRVQAKLEYPLDINFKSSFHVESGDLYQNVMKKLSQKFSVPFIYSVERVDILKANNQHYKNMYGNLDTLPTLETGFKVMKELSYNSIASCYSLPILWSYFQNMAIAAAPFRDGEQHFPLGNIFVQNVPLPTHCTGIILKNMANDDLALRFLLMEFFPLVMTQGLLGQMNRSFNKKFKKEDIAWAMHFQRLSLLYTIDPSMPDILQFLSYIGFTNVLNSSEDCFIPLIDKQTLYELKCYSGIHLFPLDHFFLNSLFSIVPLNSLYFSNTTHIAVLLRFVVTLKKKSKLYDVSPFISNPYFKTLDREATYWFKLVREYYISVLKFMPFFEFYNKDNATIIRILRSLPQQLSHVAYYDVRKVLSKDNTFTFPFSLTLSQFTKSSIESKVLHQTLTTEQYMIRYAFYRFSKNLCHQVRLLRSKPIKDQDVFALELTTKEEVGWIKFSLDTPIVSQGFETRPRHCIIHKIKATNISTARLATTLLCEFAKKLSQLNVLGPILSVQLTSPEWQNYMKPLFRITEAKTQLSLIHTRNFYWRILDRTKTTLLRFTNNTNDQWFKELEALITNGKFKKARVKNGQFKEPWYYISHLLNEVAQLFLYVTTQNEPWLNLWKKQLHLQDEFEFFTTWSESFPSMFDKSHANTRFVLFPEGAKFEIECNT